MFDTSDEKELLSASAAVLQDLGFQVEESAKEVGMLRAAKERGAREYGQEIMQSLIFILGIFGQKAVIVPVDVHQQINATLVTRQLRNRCISLLGSNSFSSVDLEGGGEYRRPVYPSRTFRVWK